ncbi:MAG: S8 family peptidase [Chloroflexales bacterium]|nr:S8 family peptidase [Chloroflexales bacterium]
MNRLPRLPLILLLLTLTVLPAAHLFARSSTATYSPREVLLKLKPGLQLTEQARLVRQAVAGLPSVAGLNGLLHKLGAYQAESLGPGSDTYLVTLNHSSADHWIAEQVAADPSVAFAEPNYTRQLMRTPNDPAVSQQWALGNIQAYDAWDTTTGGEIRIAILDTGVDGGHPDLSGKVLPGYNALTGDGNTRDDNGHGTAVAGLIAASADNGVGVAGICWGCRILPIKVLNNQGSGNDANVARGIRWAVDNGARVINMSLGGTDDSQILRDAVDYATSRNVLIVASSGNERQEGNQPNYPAAYPGVVAVGATGNTDVVTGFSNTGDYLDLTAPGVGLWTTLPEGRYGPPNGTSFASPYVSGVAGLVITLRGDLGTLDLECILEASADDKGPAGRDAEYGWGRLNALRAVQLAQEYNSCPLSNPEPSFQPQPDPQFQPQPQPDPAPSNPGSAFAPIPPFASTVEQVYFPETQHSLRGEFKRYWERNGGLPIFGYPISEEFLERSSDGVNHVVQYFERYRFEFHAESPYPYNVQLGRLGDAVLQLQGRNWFTFPKGGAQSGCLFFDGTGHSICEPFLSYWRSSGLEFDGRAGRSFSESLALFGQPLSTQQVEEVAPGVFVTVQWFERVRLEDHGSGGVLLGLLSDELARSRGWR